MENNETKHKIYVNLSRRNYYYDFSLLEMKSLFELFKIEYTIDKSFSYNLDLDPLVQIHSNAFDNDPEIADKICERSVLIKNIIKVYTY